MCVQYFKDSVLQRKALTDALLLSSGLGLALSGITRVWLCCTMILGVGFKSVAIRGLFLASEIPF